MRRLHLSENNKLLSPKLTPISHETNVPGCIGHVANLTQKWRMKKAHRGQTEWNMQAHNISLWFYALSNLAGYRVSLNSFRKITKLTYLTIKRKKAVRHLVYTDVEPGAVRLAPLPWGQWGRGPRGRSPEIFRRLYVQICSFWRKTNI